MISEGWMAHGETCLHADPNACGFVGLEIIDRQAMLLLATKAEPFKDGFGPAMIVATAGRAGCGRAPAFDFV